MSNQKVIICQNLESDLAEAVCLCPHDKLFILADEHTQELCLPLLLNFNCLKKAETIIIGAGDVHKNIETLASVWQELGNRGATRHSLMINLGGGMVTDLGGFAASTFKRGIRYINIPTTLLSQIDSSIGGKTAINFGGVKNIVGAFYQPKKVLIDPDLLQTLPPRQIANGLAEAVKMSLTSDRELFELFENRDIESNLEEIIIESSSGLSQLYHGECVALGMLPMCGEALRPRVLEVLKKCNLYRQLQYDWDAITEAAFHDKKADGGTVTVTLVQEPGSFELKTMTCLDVIGQARVCLESI